jgi:hypothetical protein
MPNQMILNKNRRKKRLRLKNISLTMSSKLHILLQDSEHPVVLHRDEATQ